MSSTPILLIVFNRFNEAKLVFEAIRFQKPTQLFISSDGARSGEENLKVQEIRNYLIEHVDWECELKTKFNDVNLGCNIGPSSAITWFFSQVSKGIILEDDCVPNTTFFSFCSKYLDLYEFNRNIWHISGSNLLGSERANIGSTDIIFSKFTFVWGWATWADRWEKYDSELLSFDSTNFIDKNFDNIKDQNYWKDIYNRVKQKQFQSCWDYQWTFTCWKNDGLSIVPRNNLIKNIGFSKDATHTANPNPFLENLKVYNWIDKGSFIDFPNLDVEYDRKVQRNVYRQYYWIRIILRLFLMRNSFINKQ